jgi:hypothetical protein
VDKIDDHLMDMLITHDLYITNFLGSLLSKEAHNISLSFLLGRLPAFGSWHGGLSFWFWFWGGLVF